MLLAQVLSLFLGAVFIYRECSGLFKSKESREKKRVEMSEKILDIHKMMNVTAAYHIVMGVVSCAFILNVCLSNVSNMCVLFFCFSCVINFISTYEFFKVVINKQDNFNLAFIYSASTIHVVSWMYVIYEIVSVMELI